MVNRKIKMCFVFDSINYGGAFKLSLNLIKLLLNDGFDISIVSLNNKRETINHYNDIIPENIKVYIVNINEISFYNRIKRLKKIFSKFDIIHSCLENANFYTGIVSLFLRNKIFVSSVHGRDGVFIEDRKLQEIFRRKEYRKYVFYVKYLQSYLFKNFKLIFSSSIDSKIFLEKSRRIRPSKIKMIYFGYLYSELDNLCNNTEIEKVKSQFNLNDSDFVIGYVGRVTYGKGLEQALIEIIKLIKENNKIKFIMVGSGELSAELRKIIDDNSVSENIFITGYVDNIVPFYKILNLFLLPSMSEGIPMVVEEAMYLNIPVLTSDAGGLPEIVRNYETGITFKKGNFIEMGNLILNFIKGKYDTDRITENANKFVLDKFNLEINYKMISKEIKNLFLK